MLFYLLSYYVNSMTNFPKIVRSNIQAELARRDVLQTTAAGWLQMSPASFGFRLSGKTDFRLGELITLAERLQVPFSTLTQGLDEALAEHKVEVAS